MGFKAAKAQVERPWSAPDGAQAVAGSVFLDRVMVPDTATLKFPHSLGKQDKGVPLEELELELQCKLSQLGWQGAPPRSDTLVPFLRVVISNKAGRFISAPAQQPLIRSLDTQAPVCQVLPPALYDALEELAQGRLTIQAEATLATKSPVLHQFVKSVGGLQEQRKHLAKFMRQLFQASRGAFPADAGAAAQAALATPIAERGDQMRPPPSQAAGGTVGKPAIEWSREESFLF